ncbi:CMRF35-like molecule 8 [Trichomycterus rosablanca]|uniref:CMRF35-like molecule 8 n=1 Tax=Trichomycterus rosablanca TaxID=2290929 RepID=UPI002F35293C
MILLTGLLCTLAVIGSPAVEAFSVWGHVGGNVSITCSHLFAWKNVKFFCNAKRTPQDVLIQSDRKHNPSVRGRFSLFDEGTGTFVVTVSDLKTNDSGTYWCGVKRGWICTYLKVDLIVSDAPAPTSYPVPTSTEGSTSSGTETMKTTESSPLTTRSIRTASTTRPPGNRGTYVAYIGAGLAALVVLLVILFLTLVKLKRRQLNYPRNKANQHGDPAAEPLFSTNQATAPDLKTPPSGRRDSGSAVDPGVTPDFSRQPDDLHYSIIDFDTGSGFIVNNPRPRKPPRVLECPYATVKTTPSSTSIVGPNSAIYATVRKVKKSLAGATKTQP